MNKLFVDKLCEQSLLKISQGDLSALSVLYDHIGRLLFVVAYSILSDYQLAEDVMHDTFVKIAEQAGSYQKNTNAKAWIVTICRNLSLNKLKRQRKEVCMEYDEISVNHVYSQKESEIDFLRLISVLSEREKEIVILRVVWNLKHGQIAKILEVKEENVRQCYKRAMVKLKKSWGAMEL